VFNYREYHVGKDGAKLNQDGRGSRGVGIKLGGRIFQTEIFFSPRKNPARGTIGRIVRRVKGVTR